MIDIGDIIIRQSTPSDEASLKKIWSSSFEDDDRFIDEFFARFGRPGMATVLETGGVTASAMYPIEGMTLMINGEPAAQCAYLYALGTLPEYRGRGYAASVCLAAANRGGAGCLMPADDALYEWYRERLGAVTRFYVRQLETAPGLLPAMEKDILISELGAKEYNALREPALGNGAHIRFSDEAMSWQEYLCVSSGGGLFSVVKDGISAVAAVEREGAAMLVKELISPFPEQALSALSHRFAVKKIIARMPVFLPGPGKSRRSVLVVGNAVSDFPEPDGAYWGPVFD